MKTAVYPGSFDPVTNGHLDIIERALKIFDELIVAVVENPNKRPLFTLKERVQILKEVLKNEKKISVDSFSGLLVNFMKKKNCNVIVKGLRAVSDFEVEFQMALMNRKLDPSVETVFFMTSNRYAFLSSSSVREIASFGKSVEGLVPRFVELKLKEKYSKSRKRGER